MDSNWKESIVKIFIELQYGYCFLIWVCHSRGLNNKSCSRKNLKNHIQWLIIIIRWSFGCFGNRNIQSHTGTFPIILNEEFVPCSWNCGLLQNEYLERRRVTLVRCGTGFISFITSKVLGFLPSEIKDSETLQICKPKIKKLCSSRLPLWCL